MSLDYDHVMSLPPIVTDHRLTERDTILYALSVGVGATDPTDPDELQFVYENGLKALPTMATVLAYPGFWAGRPEYRLNWQRILAAGLSVEIHSPLPVEGALRGVTTIDEIYDKGPERGALIHFSRQVFASGSDHPIATLRQSSLLRGDGGFGGASAGAPHPHPEPERKPDLVLQTSTRCDQALLFRLNGDCNPLHADPEVARANGFSAPILHGLATFGVVGRALLRADGPSCPELVRRIDARFSSPVYPGDTLEIDVWREGENRLAFCARVPAREVTVLRHGLVELRD